MINLSKGERFDLSKSGSALSNLRVGLGWDPVKKEGGFFSNLLGGGGGSQAGIDIDASVFMLHPGRKLANGKDLVYYNNLKSGCGSIRHGGDNLTGEGEGDDESILINLPQVPNDFENLVVTVNIYDCVSRKQHFGMVENAYVKLYDGDKVLAQFDLTEDYSGKTAIDVAELYRRNGEWRFKALGEAYVASGLKEMSQRF